MQEMLQGRPIGARDIGSPNQRGVIVHGTNKRRELRSRQQGQCRMRRSSSGQATSAPEAVRRCEDSQGVLKVRQTIQWTGGHIQQVIGNHRARGPRDAKTGHLRGQVPLYAVQGKASWYQNAGRLSQIGARKLRRE